MKTIIITAGLLLSAVSLKAQQISVGEYARTAKFNKTIDEINNGKTVLKYSDIQGNPFYKSGFSNAKVGDAQNILPVRYNLYKDSFEVLNNNDIYSIPKDITFSQFIFVESKEKFILSNDDTGFTGYFLVLVDGANKLLKKLTVTYSPEVPAPNTMIAGAPAKFDVQKPIYYIKLKNQIIKITKKTDDWINALPADKRDVLKSFIKTNKIKTNQEPDLIKLTTFLNK